jgi:large subunit ribosomal protein L24
MKIKKGDTIKVLYGKDAGKRAPVIAVNPKKNTVVVDGVNVYKRHIKGDGKDKTSEIVSLVKPMPISKVMLVCPLCNKATRIGIKIEGDKKVRICKKCGKTIDEVKTEEKATKKVVTKTKKKTTKSTTKKTKPVKKKTTVKKSTTKKKVKSKESKK